MIWRNEQLCLPNIIFTFRITDSTDSQQDQGAEQHSLGVKLPMMNKVRLWLYHYIYVPLVSLWEDHKYRNDPPLPPIPCQFCGKTDHKTKYCPNAKEMGF
jgi:hypothetical protein